MRAMLIGAVLVAANLPAAAADPKAVVEEAIKAHGGKPALTKFSADQSDFTGELSALGLDISFKGTITTAVGGKSRMELSAEVAGQKLAVLNVTNGKKVSTKTTLGGAEQPAQPGQIDELKMGSAMYDMSRIYTLLDDKRFELKAAPDADIDGKKASAITVTVKEISRDVTLYFDQTTHLLVKTSRKGLGFDGKETDHDSVMSDYKVVDGAHVPMTVTVYNDGAKFMTMKVTDYKHLEKADDKLFAVDD